jgi:hypothetical protein
MSMASKRRAGLAWVALAMLVGMALHCLLFPSPGQAAADWGGTVIPSPARGGTGNPAWAGPVPEGQEG